VLYTNLVLDLVKRESRTSKPGRFKAIDQHFLAHNFASAFLCETNWLATRRRKTHKNVIGFVFLCLFVIFVASPHF
jgi:hypothetical protein